MVGRIHAFTAVGTSMFGELRNSSVVHIWASGPKPVAGSWQAKHFPRPVIGAVTLRAFANRDLKSSGLGFDTGMEKELTAIIRRALAEARAEGKDYLTQTDERVRTGGRERRSNRPNESV
jgi:hypothetical protein